MLIGCPIIRPEREHQHPTLEPHNYRVNAAEPAVKVVNCHMIAGLATIDFECPIQL